MKKIIRLLHKLEMFYVQLASLIKYFIEVSNFIESETEL